MKYLDEFRDPRLALALLERIRARVTRPWVLMEVCGGQTHAILHHGIDQLLPAEVELIHGPGCPVCVTPLEVIDRALAIADRPGVILATFGDMLRVPGSGRDLAHVRAEGGDIRVVYSPLDALTLARENPSREVVFFGVGFETTAPAVAMAVELAHRERLRNFSVLVSHVRVAPALWALLQDPENRVEAFLAAGHVCAVMGVDEYHPIAERFGVPIVVTGFEPMDLLAGILRAVTLREVGRAVVENAYERVVGPGGNPQARQLLDRVFTVVDRNWRGIGLIPQSGWALAPAYRHLDAEVRFDLDTISAEESPLCRAGDVLRGRLRPSACPAFGHACTPATPLGAPMVSAEGACAAYYHQGRVAASGV